MPLSPVSCSSAASPRAPSCADVVGPPRAEAQAHAAEVDWTHAQHYDVILSEFHFAPSQIVLRHGEPYGLRLENRGRFRHTFTAPEFFRAVAFRPGEAATEAEQSGGSLSVAAGEVGRDRVRAVAGGHLCCGMHEAAARAVRHDRRHRRRIAPDRRSGRTLEAMRTLGSSQWS